MNRIMGIIALAVASSLTTHNSVAASASCLNYEPTVVTLTGTITRHMEYGAPNYGETPKTDEQEWYWYLDLDRPLCVNAGAKDSMNSESEHDIRQLQITYRHYPPGDRSNWVGHHASVTGTLSHSFTGHHHTAVLIDPKRTVLESGETFPAR